MLTIYFPKSIDKGINIDNPRYGTWWEKIDHTKNARRYNSTWSEFLLDNPNCTYEEVLKFGKSIMNDYNVRVNY